jgi:hypothetical protein
MAIVPLATLDDVDQLVQMRWDFSEEEYPNNTVSFEEFNQVCSGLKKLWKNTGNHWGQGNDFFNRITFHDRLLSNAATSPSCTLALPLL